MSRSGYSDDCDDNWQLIRWRGAVKSSIRGKRGQAFLKEMLAALDEMPVKRLVKNELETTDRISCSHWGMQEYESVCAIGAVGRARGIDMQKIDPDDSDTVAGIFGIPRPLACEIVFENDEAVGYWSKETPERRYQRMREWIASLIQKDGI